MQKLTWFWLARLIYNPSLKIPGKATAEQGHHKKGRVFSQEIGKKLMENKGVGLLHAVFAVN